MAFHSKLILRITRDFPLRGDFFCCHAHAVGNAIVFHVVGIRKDGGGERGRVAAHRHHAHALRTCTDHHIGLANLYRIGCHRNRGQTRSAETIDCDPAHAFGQAREHGSHAGDVQALLAFRNRAACHDVFNCSGVQIRHLRNRVTQHGGQQIIGARVTEKSAMRFTNRRARGGNDIGFLNLLAHGESLLGCFASKEVFKRRCLVWGHAGRESTPRQIHIQSAGCPIHPSR